MVISHSYVNLPEGKTKLFSGRQVLLVLDHVEVPPAPLPAMLQFFPISCQELIGRIGLPAFELVLALPEALSETIPVDSNRAKIRTKVVSLLSFGVGKLPGLELW